MCLRSKCYGVIAKTVNLRLFDLKIMVKDIDNFHNNSRSSLLPLLTYIICIYLPKMVLLDPAICLMPILWRPCILSKLHSISTG